MIKRDILEQIKGFLERNEYIAVVGPRQAGKTVLFELLVDYLISVQGINRKNIVKITFEDRKLLKQFISDPAGFISSFISGDESRTYFLIDEFQYAKDGGQKLKLVYDTVQNVKIFITGSSSLDIRAQMGKYMVGRILTFYLYPFSFGEYLRAKDARMEKIYLKKSGDIRGFIFGGKATGFADGNDAYFDGMIKHFNDYAVWGGYPAVTLAGSEQREKILADIQTNYILKDIKGFLEMVTEDEILSLATRLAAQSGGIINYNNTAALSGLNYRKLKRNLNILEETFIIQEVKPFFVNKLKELSKNPKIYFTDNGFRNSLIEDMRLPDKRTDAGALAENTVLIRLKELSGGLSPVNFYRTKAGAEVDFLVKIKGKEVPVEVKFSPFTRNYITKSFSNYVEAFNPERGIILTKDYWGIEKKGKTTILFAPVYYL